MSSAFTFFRRNQQVTMVAVVILSMLAFTLDTVFSDRGTHFVLLGLLVGAMVFSFFGISRGQWIKFGIAGGVLGAVCGFVFPKILNPSAGFFQDSALGAFDEKRMMDLQLQRNIPNMFMQRAFEKAIAPGTAMYAPQFGFGHEAGTDDLTFAEMMRAEADKLGIVVTDAMVSDWINRQTQEKLSRAAFAEIRQDLNFGTGVISEQRLLDCFRSEIKALMAYQILRPQPSSLPQGPDVYFATFKRTKVRERLNTVRLDVDAFVGQVADPSEVEIASLFQEGRLRFPNELEPGSPGFRQFSKAKLAYLELGYKKVEASLTPPTDAEIEAFYKDNQDKLYRKPAEPAPVTPAITPAEAPETPGVTPSGEPKAEEPKAEEPKAEEPKAEEPKTSDDGCFLVADEPASATGEKSQETIATPETTATSETVADRLKMEVVIDFKATPLNDALAHIAASIKTEVTIDGEALRSAGFTQNMPQTYNLGSVSALTAIDTILQKYAGERDPIVLVVDEAGKKLLISTGSKAQKDGLTPYPTKAPTADAASESAAEKSDAPSGEPAAETPAADKPASAAASDGPEFVIPKIEYKPLDDELKAEIREQLLDEKVRTALDERMNAIMSDVKKLEEKRRGYRFSLFEKQRDISKDDLYEKMRESSSNTLDALKELAAEHNCEFVETPLLSYADLIEGESYPIGVATLPAGDTIAQHVFSTFPEDVTNDTTLFVGERGVRNSFDPDGGETRYAWVITEYAPTFVPTLEDPGIRDQVVLAFKRSKARELAEIRGEELVKAIKTGLDKPEAEKKTMSESLEGATVLGAEGSPVLTMRQTLPFSWMEQSMTPQMNFMQQPTARLSSIRFADEIAGTIRYAGPKFMEVVFEELGNNDVAVVPNEEFSSYFVIQVLDRTPADQNGEDILRQQFLTEGRQFGFSRGAVATVIQSDIAGPTALEWEKATWRKYGIDPDERREE